MHKYKFPFVFLNLKSGEGEIFFNIVLLGIIVILDLNKARNAFYVQLILLDEYELFTDCWTKRPIKTE